MQMQIEIERDDMIIRRAILAPGETTQWRTDLARRFTVLGRNALGRPRSGDP
jgi:hypothetical protein